MRRVILWMHCQLLIGWQNWHSSIVVRQYISFQLRFYTLPYKSSKDSLTDELLDVLATIYRLAGQVSTTDEGLKCFYESVRRFIGVRSVRCAHNVRYERRLGVHEDDAMPMTPLSQLNKSELVELPTAAVCSWTSDNISSARGTRSWLYVAPINTTYLEALYAYKRGDYQRCFQLSRCDVFILVDGIIGIGLRPNSDHCSNSYMFQKFVFLLPEIPTEGLPPWRGGGAYAPMTRMIF